MKPSDESTVIIENALESEHNLRLAAKVGLAFPMLKERVVEDFLSSFGSVLNSRLDDGWKVEDNAGKTPLLVTGTLLRGNRIGWTKPVLGYIVTGRTSRPGLFRIPREAV